MAADANQSSKKRDFCVMHVISNTKQKLTSFTYTSWCKFVFFAAKWRKLQCREGELAIEVAEDLGLRLDDLPPSSFEEHANSPGCFLPIPAYCKFHRDCYNRFCNTQMLGREEKRQHIRDEEASETGGDVEEEASTSKYRRLSRSQTSIGEPEKGREQTDEEDDDHEYE